MDILYGHIWTAVNQTTFLSNDEWHIQIKIFLLFLISTQKHEKNTQKTKSSLNDDSDGSDGTTDDFVLLSTAEGPKKGPAEGGAHETVSDGIRTAGRVR